MVFRMKFIESSINKKLIGNILALFTLKGAEYVISFVTLPFLLRVLGPEKFGEIAFVQSIVNYGGLVVDYGFNLTAPRDIAKAKPTDISLQFSSIFYSKCLLLLIILLFYGLMILIFRDFLDVLLIICVLPNLIGNSIFPIWYFQGLQQMKFITFFNLFARFISVICIFSFVKESSDYCLAAFLQSITPLLAGIIALFMLSVSKRNLFLIPPKNEIIRKIKNGWEIFISTVFINLYTNTNIVILRLLTNDACVGYYSAASKLIEAVKGLFMPVSNAIFPHVAALVKVDSKKAIVFLKKTIKIIGFSSLIISFGVFYFASFIVHIIMGNAYDGSIIVLRIISVLPFIIGLSNIFGIQTMVAFGMQKLFSRILMFSAVLNFVLVFPFVYLWQEIGLAITVVIVECFVTVTMYYGLVRNNIVLK